MVSLAAIAGCGSSGAERPLRLPGDYLPLPPGRGTAYRLPAASPRVGARAPIDGYGCERGVPRARFGIHLELYARRRVVPVPAGIGIAPPLRRQGAYVTGGACSYPLRTREPTGVFELRSGALRLGTLFAVWGQPLSRRRLADFSGPVTAYLGGRRWPGEPGAIPLRPHSEIVLEVGGHVSPHPRYLFPHGL